MLILENLLYLVNLLNKKYFYLFPLYNQQYIYYDIFEKDNNNIYKFYI